MVVSPPTGTPESYFINKGSPSWHHVSPSTPPPHGYSSLISNKNDPLNMWARSCPRPAQSSPMSHHTWNSVQELVLAYKGPHGLTPSLPLTGAHPFLPPQGPPGCSANVTSLLSPPGTFYCCSFCLEFSRLRPFRVFCCTSFRPLLGTAQQWASPKQNLCLRAFFLGRRFLPNIRPWRSAWPALLWHLFVCLVKSHVRI